MLILPRLVPAVVTERSPLLVMLLCMDIFYCTQYLCPTRHSCGR